MQGVRSTSAITFSLQDCHLRLPGWHLIPAACGVPSLANLAAGQTSLCFRTALRELSSLAGKDRWNPEKGRQRAPSSEKLPNAQAFTLNYTCHRGICVAGLFPLPSAVVKPSPFRSSEHSTATTQGENPVLFLHLIIKAKMEQ